MWINPGTIDQPGGQKPHGLCNLTIYSPCGLCPPLWAAPVDRWPRVWFINDESSFKLTVRFEFVLMKHKHTKSVENNFHIVHLKYSSKNVDICILILLISFFWRRWSWRWSTPAWNRISPKSDWIDWHESQVVMVKSGLIKNWWPWTEDHGLQ